MLTVKKLINVVKYEEESIYISKPSQTDENLLPDIIFLWMYECMCIWVHV